MEQDDCYRWCIELGENNQVVGGIDVVRLNRDLESAVIGYCMSRKHWNKGIMTEALIENINVPTWHEMYKRGQTKTCQYTVEL